MAEGLGGSGSDRDRTKHHRALRTKPFVCCCHTSRLGSKNYTSNVAQRWSTHDAPSYIATTQPASVDDVRNIARIANSHSIPFLATGGGHGVSNHPANLQNGLRIDLRNFNHIGFDSDTRRLTIGGAVKFSQLIQPLSKSGYQFCKSLQGSPAMAVLKQQGMIHKRLADDQEALGTAYCVGVLGATLGAGVSANQGYQGLLVDLLQDVEMVTAEGEVVTASREQNSDLFWALRGAGANFGIVTSAVHEVPGTVNSANVTNANYLFPRSKATEVFNYLSSFDDVMPGSLALNIGTLYNQEISQLVLLINANFAGSREEALEYPDLPETLGPLRSEVLNVRWPDVFSTSYFGIEDTKACGRNQHVNMRSVAAKRTDTQALVRFLSELESFTKSNADISTAMMIHRFPTEKVLQVPDDESAYPHRGVNIHIQLESVYDNRKYDDSVNEFLDSTRRKFVKASGFDEPTVYVNFAHGDEGPAAWYGARKLEKLSRLKRKWDPRGVFNLYNPIPASRQTMNEL